MKEKVMVGGFSLLTYGNRSPEELFLLASKAEPIPGKAGVSGRTEFEAFIMPSSLTIDSLLKGVRGDRPPSGFERLHALYHDPDGPVIGILLDESRRVAMFSDAGIGIPETAVLFLGTSYVTTA